MKKITALLFTLLLLINGLFALPQKAYASTTATFSYTGAYQDWTVPSGVVSITLDGYGAGSATSDCNSAVGAKGGRIQTTLAVTPGEVLRLYVGGTNSHTTGGFNGGGNGASSSSGGGGATDIRQGGTDLAHRVIVAGGAGGWGFCNTALGGIGGAGGNTTGVAGSSGIGGSAGGGGGGGTSSAGGSAGTGSSAGTVGSSGQGGPGGAAGSGAAGGGGGGGYYGGGGGGGSSTGSGGGGGGGGSSYAGTGTSATTHTQGYSAATGNGAVTFTYTASVAPTITTPTQTSIAGATATLGGNVTADGGATVTGRGVCVGTSSNPVLGGTCFSTTGTTGVFTVAATGLSSATLYHYRAYATNSAGTSYTTDDSFTTATPVAPTVAVSAETNVDSISTTLNGTVNPNYGATNAWYFWGTSNVACSSLPNASASQSLGSGASPVALTSALSGFTPGVTYYYCAVALNSVGITYSAVTSFVQAGGSGCSSVSLTGSYTVSSSCVFGNGTNDGVDVGTGTQNDGVLTVAKGTTLTVGASQTVAYGIIYKPGATVVRLTGGSLRRSSIWVPDTDGDGYPDNVGTYGQIVQATQPAGYARRAVVGAATVDCAPSDATSFKNYVSYTDVDGDGYATTAIKALTCGGATLAGASATSLGVDCLDSNVNVFTNQTVATDADHDAKSTSSASSQCAGASSTVSGRTYYKDSSGNSTFVAAADIALTSDCLDSNANIYQNVSVGTDADQDGYSTAGAGSVCVGASSTVSGRTYYNDSAGAITQILSASIIGTSDCLDTSGGTTAQGQAAASVYQNINGYLDSNGNTFTVSTPTGICTGVSLLTYNVSTFPYRASAAAHSGSPSFVYTGGTQNWTVPTGVTSITAVVKGGDGYTGNGTGPTSGGSATATYAVTPGASIVIYVGASGANGGWGSISGGSNGSGTGTGGGQSKFTITGTNAAIAGGGGGGGGTGSAGSAGSAGGGGTNWNTGNLGFNGGTAYGSSYGAGSPAGQSNYPGANGNSPSGSTGGAGGIGGGGGNATGWANDGGHGGNGGAGGAGGGAGGGGSVGSAGSAGAGGGGGGGGGAQTYAYDPGQYAGKGGNGGDGGTGSPGYAGYAGSNSAAGGTSVSYGTNGAGNGSVSFTYSYYLD